MLFLLFLPPAPGEGSFECIAVRNGEHALAQGPCDVPTGAAGEGEDDALLDDGGWGAALDWGMISQKHSTTAVSSQRLHAFMKVEQRN